MIEMGGASTQIAFFEPNGDVMANLFKLQIGGARHWNIYVHSFLYFGVNGAWSRLNARLYDNGLGTSINPCLPPGYAITYESWIHTNSEEGYLLPRGSPESVPYTTTMTNDKSDFEQCSNMARVLLRKEVHMNLDAGSNAKMKQSCISNTLLLSSIIPYRPTWSGLISPTMVMLVLRVSINRHCRPIRPV
jgi:hypothetical protein